MKVQFLPSTVGAPATTQFCIAAVVNDTIAIDAGTIGLVSPIERQRQIKHIFLSHSHLDHIASLPLFLDNIYRPGPDCPSVYACGATAKCLREDVFNDRLWPDFIRLSDEESPFLKLQILKPEVPVNLQDLTVIPVPLKHVVPTMGFILQDTDSAIAVVSDTSPSQRIWEVLASTKNLRAVILDCSFPNSHRWLADKSGHLCPELFAEEIRKLPDSVKVIAYHLKPCFFDEIAHELQSIPRANLEIGVPGREYIF
ncbi:MAG: 3',5'-cyclic-nucleotide phosphodiesterase [Planctomycetota bacterium]|nr:3',5'-cyclic-nucleotide phosphodiesterase [Planctomycetota bacterium]